MNSDLLIILTILVINPLVIVGMVFINKKVNRGRGYTLVFGITALIFDLIGLFVALLIKESIFYYSYATPFTIVGMISGYIGYKRGMYPRIGSSSLGIGVLGLIGMICGGLLFFLCSWPLLQFFTVLLFVVD